MKKASLNFFKTKSTLITLFNEKDTNYIHQTLNIKTLTLIIIIIITFFSYYMCHLELVY